MMTEIYLVVELELLIEEWCGDTIEQVLPLASFSKRDYAEQFSKQYAEKVYEQSGWRPDLEIQELELDPISFKIEDVS